MFFTPGDPLRVGLAAALERALSWVMRTDLPGTTIFHPSPQTRSLNQWRTVCRARLLPCTRPLKPQPQPCWARCSRWWRGRTRRMR
uniref:Rho guanine nucleotide exchange factor 40 n=1 Tax=Mus musculus TaxID=10090 RepID=S4R237_MOUSE